ncbi:MAG: ABC transporter permease, partial [Armatimonadota bacterium]|nr:ABC transporter permease [Armatimonadota bacterium]
PAPRFALLLGIAASHAVLALAFLAISLMEFSLVLGIRFSADYGGALAVLALTQSISRVVEPVGWLLPVYSLSRTFSQGGSAPGFAAWTGTGDDMAFVVVGWMLSAYVSAVMWGMGFSLKTEMDQGVLEANWVAPASPAVLLVGRTLASLAVTTCTAAGFAVLAMWIFGLSLRGQILPAVGFALPVVVGLCGLGFMLAGIVLRLRDADTLIDVSHFTLGLLSGRDYPIFVLPRPMVLLSLVLPLTYGYDGIRALLLGTTPILPLPLQAAVGGLFMVLMVVAGLGMLRRLEYRSRLDGSLGQH